MYAHTSHEDTERRVRTRCARTRLTVVEAAIVVVCAVALVAAFLYASTGPGRHAIPRDTQLVRVAPNQSLWDLAQAYPVEGLPTADAVRYLRQLNGLSSSEVAEGQVVKVPVSRTTEAALAAR